MGPYHILPAQLRVEPGVIVIKKKFTLAKVPGLRKLLKNVASYIEQDLEATPHEAPTIRSPASYHENYPS